jgi:hypothetical protein
VMYTGYCPQCDLLKRCVQFVYLPPSELARHFRCAVGGLFPVTQNETR